MYSHYQQWHSSCALLVSSLLGTFYHRMCLDIEDSVDHPCGRKRLLVFDTCPTVDFTSSHFDGVLLPLEFYCWDSLGRSSFSVSCAQEKLSSKFTLRNLVDDRSGMDLAPGTFYWSDVIYGGSPALATRSGWMALACMPFVLCVLKNRE
jgi:hypothetical protein